MSIVLFLIVRNEARILERCLHAARPFVDHVLVVDTGSEDETPEIAERCGATVVRQPWEDFGKNRTSSFRSVVERFPEARWALTLDADMRLVGVPQRFRELLDACDDDAGCSLLQINHGTEYYNVRVLRVDRPWVCKGATHEYWCCRGGTVHEVPREVAYIQDLGDGGCKTDKFERDERLLRKELEEEPDKERDFFYLANTLLCQGKREEAAEWYKKRVEAGGWAQEVYFSCYQLAKIADRPADCEYWAQRAIEADPERNEARLFLVEQLRNRGEHYRAWGYLTKANDSKPSDKLFLEAESHEGRVAYERSILHYYVSPDRSQGMRYMLEAIAKYDVLPNLRFYALQLQAERERRYFPEPEGFWAGSVSVNREGLAVVRTADYFIEPEGGWYRWRSNKVTTRNYRSRYDFDARTFSGFEEIVVTKPPLRDSEVVGLEDVRVCGDLFTATQKQWTPGGDNLMAIGSMSTMEFTVAESPDGSCQKNWLPLPDKRLLYSWSPLTIGALDGNGDVARLVVHESHSTPAWWKHLRGSASPCRIRGRWVAIAHMVAPRAPREYFSVLVELEPPAWIPKAYSLPFYFFASGVEYVLSAQSHKDEVHFFVSRMDRESYVVVARASDVLALLTERVSEKL